MYQISLFHLNSGFHFADYIFLFFNFIFTGKNVLNKSPLTDHLRGCFSSYDHFCDVITPIFDELFPKTHLWPSLSFVFPNRCMLIFFHWNRSINEDFSFFKGDSLTNLWGISYIFIFESPFIATTDFLSIICLHDLEAI